MTYDSTNDTAAHTLRVGDVMQLFVGRILVRMASHDASKLLPPEKETFDEFTPKLKTTTYGSPEYKDFLKAMAPALTHHYAANRHHPEHFPAGVAGMNLIDLLEMFCDWKAASERHADGTMERSLRVNAPRYAIDGQLLAILYNTARDFGWIPQEGGK